MIESVLSLIKVLSLTSLIFGIPGILWTKALTNSKSLIEKIVSSFSISQLFITYPLYLVNLYLKIEITIQSIILWCILSSLLATIINITKDEDIKVQIKNRIIDKKNIKLYIIFIIVVSYVLIFGFIKPYILYPKYKSEPWGESSYSFIDTLFKSKSFVAKTYQYGQLMPSDQWPYIYIMGMEGFIKILSPITSIYSIHRIMSIITYSMIILSIYQYSNSFFNEKEKSIISSLIFISLPRLSNYGLVGEIVGIPILLNTISLISNRINKKPLINLEIILNIISLGVASLPGLIIGLVYCTSLILSKRLNNDQIRSTSTRLFLAFLLGVTPILTYQSVFGISRYSHTGSLLYHTTSETETNLQSYFYSEYFNEQAAYDQGPWLSIPIYIGAPFRITVIWSGTLLLICIISIASRVLNLYKPSEKLVVLSNWFVFTALLSLSYFILNNVLEPATLSPFRRFMLYTQFQIPILAVTFVSSKLKNKFKQGLGLIICALVIGAGSNYFVQSANMSNQRPEWYLDDYEEVFESIIKHTSEEEVILTNQWGNGEIASFSNRVGFNEGAHGSARYLTYSDMVPRLEISKDVLSSNNASRIVELIKFNNISSIVLRRNPGSDLPSLVEFDLIDKVLLGNIFDTVYETENAIAYLTQHDPKTVTRETDFNNTFLIEEEKHLISESQIKIRIRITLIEQIHRKEYYIFTHIIKNGTIVQNIDHYPSTYDFNRMPVNHPIKEYFEIDIESLSPGTYEIVYGIVDIEKDQRLLTENGENHIQLVQFIVH